MLPAAFQFCAPLLLNRPTGHSAVCPTPRMAAAQGTPPPSSDERPPDGPFGRAAIFVFRRVMQPFVGTDMSRKVGYAGLVDDCRALLARNTPAEQRSAVLSVLAALFVSPRGPMLFRERFSDKPQMNARITPLFFRWLVGPAEVNDSPEGGPAGSGVLIEKCRFLDESGCKGLCLNMCQQPTQAFFTNELGLPLRMTPDFETKSCQMSFGLAPLPIKDDPAFQGTCIEACKMVGQFKIDPNQDKVCYVKQPLEEPQVPTSAPSAAELPSGK